MHRDEIEKLERARESLQEMVEIPEESSPVMKRKRLGHGVPRKIVQESAVERWDSNC